MGSEEESMRRDRNQFVSICNVEMYVCCALFTLIGIRIFVILA